MVSMDCVKSNVPNFPSSSRPPYMYRTMIVTLVSSSPSPFLTCYDNNVLYRYFLFSSFSFERLDRIANVEIARESWTERAPPKRTRREQQVRTTKRMKPRAKAIIIL